MKAGLNVRDKSGRTGVSQGPVFRYGVWWILVVWDDAGFDAIVLEDCLEVIDGDR